MTHFFVILNKIKSFSIKTLLKLTLALVIGNVSEPPPKKEKKESKKLTAWCGCSCSTAPMSRFFLGAAIAFHINNERRTTSNLIASSEIFLFREQGSGDQGIRNSIWGFLDFIHTFFLKFWDSLVITIPNF